MAARLCGLVRTRVCLSSGWFDRIADRGFRSAKREQLHAGLATRV